MLFSSIAALLGAPGQTNYCAANAELDAIAVGLQTAGTPVVSVQWGAWAGAGMAARVRITESKYPPMHMAEQDSDPLASPKLRSASTHHPAGLRLSCRLSCARHCTNVTSLRYT